MYSPGGEEGVSSLFLYLLYASARFTLNRKSRVGERQVRGAFVSYLGTQQRSGPSVNICGLCSESWGQRAAALVSHLKRNGTLLSFRRHISLIEQV